MFKTSLYIILFFLCPVLAKAQSSYDKTIGLRFGGGNGFGIEASFQDRLSSGDRFEIDLGWRSERNYDLVKVTGIYQWLWNIEGALNWYAGVGGGIGTINDHGEDNIDQLTIDGVFLYAAGNLGIEYDFDIPLMISLDFRPEVNFANYKFYNNLIPDIALSARYQF